MTPEVRQYIKDILPEFNKYLAKELNIEEVKNIEAGEYKLECLARIKAVKLAKKFINKITEGEFKKELKEDFGDMNFIVEK